MNTKRHTSYTSTGITLLCGIAVIMLVLIPTKQAQARPHGITGGFVKCGKHKQQVCPPKHKHHHKKTSNTSCVVTEVRNGERVTHQRCLPREVTVETTTVSVENPPSGTAPVSVIPNDSCTQEEIQSKQCELNFIMPNSPVVDGCDQVCPPIPPEEPGNPCEYTPSGCSPAPEENKCATKICVTPPPTENPPKEECPEESKEVTGPKG